MRQLNAQAIDRSADQAYPVLRTIQGITVRPRVHEVRPASGDLNYGQGKVPQRQAELMHALRINTVGKLATCLAHELNQPLSSIANGVEACECYVRSGKATSHELLALLRDVSAEALRAGRIVKHLRAFIETGTPAFEPTDLCEIVRNVPRFFGREIEREDITLRLDVYPRPLPIYADSIQIEQIIVNLLQNAIDAIREAPSDRNEIELRVRAAKGMGEVSARDTGAGVSDAAIERMFEPFFTTKSDGLGMGLAISRSILDAHGGRMWVKRPADGSRGTTVGFSLPLRQPR
jgi:C4-dicarboxylate-specific signal transduction histidine kinase